MINVFETEMLAGETGIKFFNCSAFEYLSHINLSGCVYDFALAKCGAETGGQMLAQHAV